MLFNAEMKATSKNHKPTLGIYSIKNLVNNKIYVGSSIDLYTRYFQHKSDLNKGIHKNKHLQNAWNKYGSNNFSFSIIEIVRNETELLKREQFWIDKLNVCNREIGYNIVPIAGNTIGRKMTYEQVLANRLRQKGSKPILQFDLEGNFIKEWNSISELHRELGIAKNTIQWALKNRNKVKNEYFLILKSEFTNEILEECISNKLGRKGKPLPSKNKKVNQHDKDGRIIKIWESITIASQSLNIQKSHIVSCCKDKRKTTGGFIWSYAN